MPESEIAAALAAVGDTIEAIGTVISRADESFAPHVRLAAEARAGSALERVEASRSASGPIRRYAERLIELETEFRGRIDFFIEAFDRGIPRREPGTDVLLPMLAGLRASVASSTSSFLAQGAGAAEVLANNTEPHVQAAFGQVLAALDKMVEDTRKLVAFTDRALARLRP